MFPINRKEIHSHANKFHRKKYKIKIELVRWFRGLRCLPLSLMTGFDFLGLNSWEKKKKNLIPKSCPLIT